jgi:hypothetical protein
MPGLVVGYSDEASLNICRVADLVATQLASKHLEHVRTSKLIAKAMQTRRICRLGLHVDSRGKSWIACESTWTRRPALAIGERVGR